MSAFFSSIRNYFKSKYHGRYLSVILREVAQHEPESFSLMIDQIAVENPLLPFWREVSKGISDGDYTVKCEHPFVSKIKKTRRADLAVLRGKDHVVLMEVKEFDHLAPGNLDQLVDYLDQVSERAGFVHVHRFLPPPAETAKIERKRQSGWPVAMLSYDQIYKAVSNAAEEQRPLGALLSYYLEDIGVGIYRPVAKDDRKALEFLMAQMLGLGAWAGMQSEEVVRRGPKLIGQLLANVEVIGEWVRQHNETIMRTRCSTRFWINPWFNQKKLRKDLADSGDRPGSLPDEFTSYVSGGQTFFVARVSVRDGSLKSKNGYLYLELGFGLEVSGKGSSVRFFVYTHFSGSGLKSEDTYENSGYFTRISDRARRLQNVCILLAPNRRS